MKQKNGNGVNHIFRAAAMLPTAMLSVGVVAPAPLAYAQGALEEVIVTAQRREESLQDVPISVAAFSREALARSGVNATIALFASTSSTLTDA